MKSNLENCMMKGDEQIAEDTGTAVENKDDDTKGVQ